MHAYLFLDLLLFIYALCYLYDLSELLGVFRLRFQANLYGNNMSRSTKN